MKDTDSTGAPAREGEGAVTKGGLPGGSRLRYTKPELRRIGKIKPKLLGSPPDPPGAAPPDFDRNSSQFPD